MKLHRNQQGVGHIAAIVLVVVVAAVAVVGYRVSQSAKDNATTASTTSSTSSSAVPTKINSKADVQQANKALDNSGIDGSVDPSSLDQDLSSLL